MANAMPAQNWSKPESVNLPSELRISKFAEARVNEINALSDFIGAPRHGALPSQQLPKHLRRRAVSHNPNRLPKRLRQRHIGERAKSTGNVSPVPTKRPSRKFRRRPSNLLNEYNRRQRKAQWLETHIWHAKRFRMSPAATVPSSTGYCQDSRWGYKLADFPNDKSFRACYRAVVNKCLMQDISFFCCIELNGPLKSLLGGLAMITGPLENMGQSFDSPNVLNGRREGFAWVYQPQKFPYEVVGKVSFFWKPVFEDCETRTVWIWSHPAFYDEVWEILKAVFTFRKISNQLEESLDQVPARKKMKYADVINEQKMALKNVPGDEKAPKFLGTFLKSEVNALLLKDTLNRFRLVGPLSQTILKNSLLLTTLGESNQEKIDTEMTESTKAEPETESLDLVLTEPRVIEEKLVETKNSDPKKFEKEIEIVSENNNEAVYWWKTYFQDKGSKEFLEKEETFWSKFDQFLPGQMPSGLMFGLVVRDPRKLLPPKRGCAQIPPKVVDEKEESDQKSDDAQISGVISKETFFNEVPIDINPLWDWKVRDSVTSSKVPDHRINQMRSQLLAFEKHSDGKLPLDSSESRLPILLIHQAGSRDQNGFGSGWDIIAPAGWGMSLWMNFIFQGARVGGLRERRQLDLEMGRLGHLDNCPDSKSGKAEIEREKYLLKAVHLSYPPDKRPNYLKLGTATPFEAPWSILVYDWSKKLVLTKDSKVDPDAARKCQFFVLRDPSRLNIWKRCLEKNHSHHISKSKNSDLELSEADEKGLLPVQIDIKGKGTISPNSMICWPSRIDLEQFFEHLSTKNSGETFVGPTEPLQTDLNEKRRKSLKEKHSKEKVSSRKKCKCLKDKIVALQAEKLSYTAMPQPPQIDLKNVDEKIKKLSTDLDQFKGERRRKNIEFANEMEKLWIDDINCDKIDDFVPTVRPSSTREIMGYVTFGGTCYRKSHHTGLGYVPMTAVKQLIAFTSTLSAAKDHPLYVLVRQPHSQQYRYASLSVASQN